MELMRLRKREQESWRKTDNDIDWNSSQSRGLRLSYGIYLCSKGLFVRIYRAEGVTEPLYPKISSEERGRVIRLTLHCLDLLHLITVNWS